MKPQYIIALALVAALAGCRTKPYVNAHIESVNAEYRNLEDQYYSLKYANQQLTADIARLEDENTRLRDGGTAPSRSNRGSSRGSSRSPAAASDSLEIAPPQIEMGTETSPPSVTLPGANKPVPKPTPRTPRSLAPPVPTTPRSTSVPSAPRRSGLMSLEPPAIEIDQPAESSAAPAELPSPAAEESHTQEPEPIDGRVTHIFLNPLQTGGGELDAEPGDDGLSVLIEPRNDSDQFVPQAGKISIAVLDPAKQGDAARVARWEFDAAAMNKKLNKSSSGRGIHLQMPWPGKPPENQNLKLFVRYETADGRKLQVDRDLQLTSAGQVSNRWTPRPADRPRHAPIEVAQQPKPPANYTPVGASQPAVQPLLQPAPTDPDVANPPLSPPPAGLDAAAPQPRTASSTIPDTGVRSRPPVQPNRLPATSGASTGAAPGLLAPPPPRQPAATGNTARPQWSPYR